MLFDIAADVPGAEADADADVDANAEAGPEATAEVDAPGKGGLKPLAVDVDATADDACDDDMTLVPPLCGADVSDTGLLCVCDALIKDGTGGGDDDGDGDGSMCR